MRGCKVDATRILTSTDRRQLEKRISDRESMFRCCGYMLMEHRTQSVEKRPLCRRSFVRRKCGIVTGPLCKTKEATRNAPSVVGSVVRIEDDDHSTFVSMPIAGCRRLDRAQRDMTLQHLAVSRAARTVFGGAPAASTTPPSNRASKNQATPLSSGIDLVSGLLRPCTGRGVFSGQQENLG